jgi:hypothetical protein
MPERNRRTTLTDQLRQGDVSVAWRLPIKLLFDNDSLPRLLQVSRANLTLQFNVRVGRGGGHGRRMDSAGG